MAREQDRFDVLPRGRGRIGAHRGKRSRAGVWIGILTVLVAIVLVTTGALFVASRLLDVDFGLPWLAKPTSGPAETETAAPPTVTDPSTIDPARGITVLVLNGTPVAGLQDTVFQELQSAGWPVVSRANAADRGVLDTIVYYSNPGDIDVARGLVAALGVGETRSVAPGTYPGATITIILGADHPLVPQPEGAESGAPAGP